MSTPRGDPEGPTASARGGAWGALWRRLTRAQTPRAAGGGPEGPQGTYSREALQAMIQRKRHNDLLRHREFDALRRLRQAQADAAPASLPLPVPFHSSVPSSPDERASTLRKIDEIEAQMARQWRPSQPDGPGAAQPVPRTGAAPSRACPGQAPAGEGGAALLQDPELEEAALLFAAGDWVGAERAVLALIAPGQPRADDLSCWQVLFDLYRATGQDRPYETRAVDYAARFDRSPPQWRRFYAPPEAPSGRPRGRGPMASPSPESPQGVSAVVDWACPPVLDAGGVGQLQAALASRPQPWRLSWTELTRLEPDGLVPLAGLVAQWSREAVSLRLVGIDRLERILDSRTACGDRRVDPAWWVLRMDWLRALRRGEEFEWVALDYCVTYEVSPPAWDPPRCDIRVLGDGGAGAVGTGHDRAQSLPPAAGEWCVLSNLGASVLPSPAAAELAGTLLGDAAAELARLDAALEGADILVVSCSRLERIDFEAASAIANWAAARQAEGRAVHLTEVHRLVAPLLGVVGLPAQVHITLRRD